MNGNYDAHYNDDHNNDDHNDDRADTAADPFLTYDAAYVLGALDEPDRIAFEAHLATCDACSASVAQLRALPPMLAGLPESAFAADEPALDEAPPDTLLPRLLREVRPGRRPVRRWVSTGLAAAAAVIAIAGASAIAYNAGHGGGSDHGVAMSALVDAPVQATAKVVSTSSGSDVYLWCKYSAESYSAGNYWLVIHSKDGKTQQLAQWPGVPGTTIVLRAPTTWTRADISDVQVTAGGKTLLTMTPQQS